MAVPPANHQDSMPYFSPLKGAIFKKNLDALFPPPSWSSRCEIAGLALYEPLASAGWN